MRFKVSNVLLAGIASACVFLAYEATVSPVAAKGHEASASQTAHINIEYPLNGSIFPPEITPPTFLFHDSSDAAKRWVVEVSFADHSNQIRMETAGDFMQLGENDPNAGEPAALTPEQATTRTWKPDTETWEKIKRLSVKSPATVTISGYADANSSQPVSAGRVTISTSKDPVGAPVFYRNVPLIVSGSRRKGSNRAAAPDRNSFDQVGVAQHRRAQEPYGDGEPADLCQLSFVFARWKDDGDRYGRPQE